MTANAIAPFLASAQDVEIALRFDADFNQFLALSLRSSGEAASEVDPAAARYRIVDGRLGLRDDLHIDESVMANGLPTPIRELISANCEVERTRLIHSLWRLETFDETKAWLKAMGAIVRFAYDMDRELRGHLLLAETVIPMLETVERKDYVLPNGDMASDAITRNLGIRAKVFALDRQRRSAPSNSIMDRLSRTLSKGV